MEFTQLISPIKNKKISKVSYGDLIFPMSKKESKSFSKLKNISKKQFLTNQALVQRYGLFRDTDKDGYLNYKDCFAFDKTRHGGQQDILMQNISQLSPEVQGEVYEGLQTGRYGSVLSKAKAGSPEFQKARLYLDQFFNTPEGRRFGAKEVYITPYSQRFENPGQVNVKSITPKTKFYPAPSQQKQSYIDPRGVGMSVSQTQLEKGIQSGTIKAGGTYRGSTGEYMYKYGQTQIQQQIVQSKKQEQIIKQQQIEKAKEDFLSKGMELGRQETRGGVIFLKPGEVRRMDGTSDVLYRIPDRDRRNVLKKVRDRVGDFIGDSLSIEKGYEEAKETYSPGLGMFVSASPTGEKASVYSRPPTKEEKVSIEKAQYEGDLYGAAVYKIPSSYLTLGVSQLTTGQLKDEEIGGLYKEGYVETLGSLVNPLAHFDVFKSDYDYKQALKEARKTDKKLESLNKKLREGKIKHSEYSAKWNVYYNDPSYQKVMKEQEMRGTIYQKISKSDLTPRKKILSHTAIAGIDFLSFAVPTTRIVRGAEAFVEGGKYYGEAETKQEKLGAGFQVGVGGLLVGSGFSGGASLFGQTRGIGGRTIQRLSKFETKLGISGGVGQRLLKFGGTRTGRITGRTISEVPPVGISGLYGAGIYEQTGDPYAALGAGVGAYAGIKVPGATQRFIKDPLTKIEAKKLESELTSLEKSKIIDTTIIKVGKGTKLNSDKVEIVGFQKTDNFYREVKVKGDLIRTEKGAFFFPEGKGISQTSGRFKTPNEKERLFTNVQSFELGAKGKGINIGQKGNVIIGTSVGTSTYIPKASVSQIIKKPTNLYESIKESIRLKLKPPIKDTGKKIVKEIDTDLSPKTLTIRKEDSVVKSFGLSVSRGRRGTFFEIGEARPSDVKVIKGRGKKTPFSKTFGIEEPVSKPLDLVSPRIKTSQIKPKKLTPPKAEVSILPKSLKTSVKESSRLAIKGVRETTKPTQKMSNLIVGRSLEVQRDEKREAEVFKEGQVQVVSLYTPSTQKERQDLVSTQLINQTQKLRQEVILSPPSTFFYGETLKPTIETPPFRPLGFIDKERSKPIYKKEQAYDAFYLVEGTKRPRYEKIEGGLTLKSALGAMSRYVDKNISARGKVEKTKTITRVNREGKEEKIKPLAKDTKDDYWSLNKHKFRGYKTRKQIPLPRGTFIEKQRYRLDSPQEKRGLAIGRKGRRTPFGF